MSKHELLRVQRKLQEVGEFLVDYLPLANAHNSDFLVLNHWENLLHSDIATELLSLSSEQLIALPSTDACVLKSCINQHTEEYKSAPIEVDTVIQGEDVAPVIFKPNKKLMVCKYHRQKSRQLKPKWDRKIRPHWHHKTLATFLAAAHHHTLSQLNVLTDVTEFTTLMSEPSCLTNRVTITNFMSSKKSYEVDVMSDLCATLSKHFGISKVSIYISYEK